MGYSEERVSVRDGMFNVTVRHGGRGDPLVYLHGAGGQGTWDPFMDMLAEEYTVYSPVHPGWPGSEGLDHLEDVIDMALFYLDLFDTLGLREINLVGNSLGGMFAAEIAVLGRSYVRRLVLCEPAGIWLDEYPVFDFFAALPEDLMKALYHDPEKIAAQTPPVDPEDKEAMAQVMLDRQMAGAAAAKFVWPIWDKGLKRRIHRIKMPTLIVWGENDGLVSPVYGSEFQRLIPGSELVVMPETAHVPMSEHPEEFVGIVRDFLKSADS
jgi:pimeloyl-ACP methyl ester carboxylesterase